MFVEWLNRKDLEGNGSDPEVLPLQVPEDVRKPVNKIKQDDQFPLRIQNGHVQNASLDLFITLTC
jgi:hypothetical protein